jgi:N-acetylmuramoyl-L-alanine amidase
MRISDHRLEGVSFEATPNMGGVITPEYLIIHYTVVTSAKATVQASAHLVLDTNGSFTQLVPFNQNAWHAGKSEWAGRSGCNEFTIGIEVVNPGPLVKRATGFFDVNGRGWSGDVFEGKHKHGRASWTHWAAYTVEQIEALRELGPVLARAYGLRDVVGHEDVAPGRKTDPGPAFPLESLRASMFGRNDDRPDLYVTTSVLNVRKGPAVSFDTVTGSPLAKGRTVQPVDEDGVWRHVMTPDGAVEGWVHGRYLAPA